VLYLRTFGESNADYLIISSISQDAWPGDKAGRRELSRFWAMVPGNHLPLERSIDYVQSNSSSWKVKIHKQNIDADIIVAFVSSKGSPFPPLSHAPPGNISQADYLHFLNQIYSIPLSRHMSGIGLLREIGYIQRLGAISKVVTICRIVQFDEIINLIHLAGFAAHGFAHSADWRKIIAPRMTLLDQQIRWIETAYGPLPFKDPSPGSRMIDDLAAQLDPACDAILAGHTKSLYEKRWGSLEYIYPAGTPDSELPIGRSRVARSLPPDHKRKVFRYWKVKITI
jgi:hypothetical protein